MLLRPLPALALGAAVCLAAALLAGPAVGHQSPVLEPGADEPALPAADLAPASWDEPKEAVLRLVRLALLRAPTASCCPAWRNLTHQAEVLDELRRRRLDRDWLDQLVLVNELKRSYYNITYLSIDGQTGLAERDKYYRFLDTCHYFLRLLSVSQAHLNQFNQSHLNESISGQISAKDADYVRTFSRLLRSMEFGIKQDQTISSFLAELTGTTSGGSLLPSNHQISAAGNQPPEPAIINPNFTYFEDFIKNTEFGKQYEKNISMIREHSLVFNQICAHLTSTEFPSNFTRPSKQFEIVHRMSEELFRIAKELADSINPRIRSNRQDVKQVFERLHKLIKQRPYIRLLGDQSDASAKKFTRLLHLYLNNNLTPWSFYGSLADFPESYIALGSKIAHDFENLEVPQYNRFYDDYPLSLRTSNSAYQPVKDEQTNNSKASSSSGKLSVDVRQNNFSYLTKIFG